MTLYTIPGFPSEGLISAQIVKCGFCGWQGESQAKRILKVAGKDFPIECQQCGAIGLAPLDKLNHIPHNARMSPKIKPKAGKRKSVTRRPRLRGRGGPGRGQGAHPIIPGTRQLKRAVFLDDETFAFYVKAGGVHETGQRAGQPRGASAGMRAIAKKWAVFKAGVEAGVKNGNFTPDTLKIFEVNGQEV